MKVLDAKKYAKLWLDLRNYRVETSRFEKTKGAWDCLKVKIFYKDGTCKINFGTNATKRVYDKIKKEIEW